MSGEVDFAALGLLDGLEGEERAGRERLLARLHTDGVSVRDLEARRNRERTCPESRRRLVWQTGHLPSRITAIARPGSVLAAEGVRETFGKSKETGRFQFTAAGDRELKGISRPVRLYRVRRGT
jgi:hypothetical protein